jgi:hypothetical protein
MKNLSHGMMKELAGVIHLGGASDKFLSETGDRFFLDFFLSVNRKTGTKAKIRRHLSCTVESKIQRKGLQEVLWNGGREVCSLLNLTQHFSILHHS